MHRDAFKIIVVGQVVEAALVLIVLSLQGLIGRQVVGILVGSPVVLVGAGEGFAIWSIRGKLARRPRLTVPEPSQSGMSTDEFFGSAILVVAFLGFLIVPPALLPSSIHALWVAVLLTAFILIGVGYWIWLFRRSRRTA